MSRSKKVLVVGGGGREHALAWKLSCSDHVAKVYCAPGNGGTVNSERCCNVDISIDEFEALADFACQEKIDLVVIGPDNPLADGIVDFLESRGLLVFGPRKQAALLESSKVHAKELMSRLGIPTARYAVFTSKGEALDFARCNEWARVVKVDGLALGKGVFVCESIEEVEEALSEILERGRFGKSGSRVLIEEKLQGEELSLFLLLDGKSVLELAPCQDHKRRFAGDTGPNTGGMGAYSPVPLYEDEQLRRSIESAVLAPLTRALECGELEFKGVLFLGLMISDSKPNVLEFNVRFGDPETQALMPRLTSDLYELLHACASGSLADLSSAPVWLDGYSVCVVACAGDYPSSSSKGAEISIGEIPRGVHIFHSGTTLSGKKLLTAGGRVLSVVAVDSSGEEARALAYKALSAVVFDGVDWRADIGWRLSGNSRNKIN